MSRNDVSSSEVLYEKHANTDFTPSRRPFGARARMLLFLAVGILAAILHYLFYAYLNNTSTQGNVLHQQGIANAVGNALAYLVNTLFSAAIGIVFVQQLWLRLRSHEGGVPIREIDVLTDCKDGIATPAALRAWRYAFRLFAIAALATAMGVITVFVPGSLHVTSASFHSSAPCNVNTVNLPNGSALDPFFLQWFERRIITQGTYLPPSSSCEDSCRYNISFEAPAFNCTNITSTYDFSPFLTLPIPSSVSPGLNLSSPKYIYNGTQIRHGTGIQVATLNTSDFTTSAVECLAFRASYDVTVTHSNVSTAKVDVRAMRLIAPVPDVDATIVNNATGILQLANAAIGLLNGTLFTNIYSGSLGSSAAFFTQPSPVMGSPLLILQNNLWRWTASMQDALPSIMQNISLSILSGEASAASAVPVVSAVESTCFEDATYYVFQQVRLVATYAATALATAACIAAGLLAVRRNGGLEESLGFSRLLGALVNAKMVEGRELNGLTSQSHLKSVGELEGMLEPCR